MKILSLKINGYKNLKEKVIFDFSQTSNYAALIGLNGSGKSNILEAISIIFASLYTGRKISKWNDDQDISYTIKYKLRNLEIEVTNGVIKLIKEDEAIKNKRIRTNKLEYLPTEVIACYSGDESRLWDDIYSKFYFSYLTKISKGFRATKQNLVYLNKFSWEYALITLLCHTNSQAYLKDLLKVEDLASIGIEFEFADNYEHRKVWFSKNVEIGLGSSNEIIELVQRIKTEQETTQEELAYTQISSIELRVNGDNQKFCRKLFYLLFAAGMPRENKLFKKININFNGLSLKELSEGEKKILLIKCLTDVLANENSLILLDEPDSHIHIARKREVKNLIDKPGYFTMLTTHSPSLLNSINDNNIFILTNKDDTGINILPPEKQKHLKEITGGEFTLMNATLASSTNKDILLVEGTNDYNYLQEALRRFNTEYPNFPFLIINCGGADNVTAVLEQSILPILNDNQFCLCAFDYDGQGRTNFQKIKIIKQEGVKTNIDAIYHPNYNGTEHTQGSPDFFMEDYFLVESYKPTIIETINRKNDFKNLEQYEKPKAIIAKHYKTFEDNHYVNFKVILDRIIEMRSNFHTSITPP
jgi:predicted ATP-dependent endonuclease of OLD family